MTGAAAGQPLVGRQPALAAVRSAADAAAGGRGRLVLVTGEPGIGKTAVLAEAAGEAADAGALVVWAQCWDGDGAPAYWPWVQVLRAGMAAGGDAGEAAMVLPEQAVADPAPVSATGAERFRLFDAVVSFLARLAARRPVLVVLDDLHWADEGSLRLLEFASRHLAAAAVLLLGAYRDEEAGPLLSGLAAMNEQVRLPGLGPGDVAALMAALAGATPAEHVAADVWRRTGGNPFLVRELTRLRLAQGSDIQHTAPARELQATVADILERRLARLSQRCVDLLTVAAVIGSDVRLEVLATMTEEADALPVLLDEAVQARVLLEPAAPVGPYRFSHDLFRETILAGLTTERRTQLHLAVARALESLREEGGFVHPAELASHFAAAVVAAPAEAVRYATLAAEDATSRLAFEEARGHYERALAALDLAGQPDPTERLEVLLQLGDARNRAGDARGAHSAYREAAALARRLHDATGLTRAAIGMHTLGWRNVHAETIALLEEAVGAAAGTPSVLRARVLAALARDLHHSHSEQDWQRAPVLAEEAVTIARDLADPATLAFALLALHDARWRPGTAAGRLPIVDEMLAASDDADDPDMRAQAHLLRATALIELGDPEGPTELEAYCRLSEELGHARARYGARSRRATAALIAGDLTRAQELAEEAYVLGTTVGEPDARGVYETLMWAVSYAGGTWHTSDLHAGPSLDSQPWPGLPLLEAVVQVASGDLSAAGRALRRLHLDDLPQTYDLEMLAFAARTVTAAGSDQQRTHLYTMLAPYAGGHIVVGGCASYFGAVDHHLGLLAGSLGRRDDARAHFEAAAAQHDRLGAPAMAERSRLEAGASPPAVAEPAGVFRRHADVWTIAYRGTKFHLPDSKGLRDLAVLLASPGRSVHAVELLTGRPPQTGADAVLDDRAKETYRRRLAELEAEVDEAEGDHDTYRAEKARAERDALVAELSAAVGLGGRDRRLGDERERARKAVTARIREAIRRIQRANPELGTHLRDAVHTGSWCTYAPEEPVRWQH